MNAGIAMKDMIAGCSVGYVKKQLCVDLNHLEQGAGPNMPVVMKASTEEIIYMQLDSRMTMTEFEEAMKVSADGCKQVKKYLELAIREHMGKIISRN